MSEESKKLSPKELRDQRLASRKGDKDEQSPDDEPTPQDDAQDESPDYPSES